MVMAHGDLRAFVAVRGGKSPKGKGKGAKGGGKGGKSGKSGDAADTSRNAMKKWNTAAKTPSDKWICKAFNDRRGCWSPCPDSCEHVCDVVLQTGKTCLASNHGRMGHNPKSHGFPGTKN